MMDSRLTRIQQRYLISERASNCSSSNTPEVKLEQRRRKRRASETKTQHEKEKAVKRLNETTSIVSGDAQREKSPIARPLGEECGNSDSSNSSSRRIKFSKSPVVKLHRIQTPPSAGLPRALSQALGEKTAQEKQQSAEASHTGVIAPPPGDPALSSSRDTDQTHPTDSSSGAGPSNVTHKLRRSPRKNKWGAGKSAKSSSAAAGEDKQVTRSIQSRKKVRFLYSSEKIIVWCSLSLHLCIAVIGRYQVLVLIVLAVISFLFPLETGTDNSCFSEEEGHATQSRLLQEVLQPALYSQQELSQGTLAVVAH